MIHRATPTDGVALVTIDRPERRNALDVAHCEALRAALDAGAADARVVVLTGAGAVFCAGADLREAYTPAYRAGLIRLLEHVGALSVPVVAAVNGPAIGAGAQLAVAADLCTVAPTARFAVPAGHVGNAIAQWTVRRLVHLVGGSTARRLLLGDEQLDAPAALACGLAQRPGDLDEALRWAARLALLAPLTLRAHKLALERCAPDEDDPDAQAAIRATWESEDLAEGLAAFRAGRPARFVGR